MCPLNKHRRFATPSERAVAAEQLRKACEDGGPILWTGRGASFALAQGFAACCRRLGAAAFAVPASEVADVDLPIVLVSRSASPSPYEPFLVVSEDGSPLDWTSAPCLAVPNPDGESRPWLPLAFGASLARTVAAALGIELHPLPLPDVPHDGKTHVIVAERCARPIVSLLEASETKIGPVPFLAVDREEVGHGLHSRFWSDPHRFVLHCVGDESSAAWGRLRKWCRGAGVSIEWLHAEHVASPGAPLDLLLLASGLLERWCRLAGISAREPRLPASVDTLR